METIEALSVILKEMFADEYTIYIGNPGQGLEKPCLLITPLLSVQQEFLAGRRKTDISYMIQFFPESEQDGTQNCIQIGNKLLEELDVLETEKGRIRCTCKQYEIVDGVLQFSMNCNTVVNKPLEETEKMQQAILKNLWVEE